MPPRRGLLDLLYWSRLARWCALGTLVMLLWLLAPVARCAYAAFRDTPIGEVQPGADPSVADKGRIEQGRGFWSTFTSATKRCYLRTPLLGQEPWKGNLLIGFAVATVLLSVVARLEARRRRTYES